MAKIQKQLDELKNLKRPDPPQNFADSVLGAMPEDLVAAAKNSALEALESDNKRAHDLEAIKEAERSRTNRKLTPKERQKILAQTRVNDIKKMLRQGIVPEEMTLLALQAYGLLTGDMTSYEMADMAQKTNKKKFLGEDPDKLF